MLRAASVQRVMFVPELGVQIAVLELRAVAGVFGGRGAQAGMLLFVGEIYAACAIVFAHLQAQANSHLILMIVLAILERVFSCHVSPSEPGEGGWDFCAVALWPRWLLLSVNGVN